MIDAMTSYICLSNQWLSDNFHRVIEQHIKACADEMPAGTDPTWIRERVLKSWLDAACPAGNA